MTDDQKLVADARVALQAACDALTAASKIGLYVEAGIEPQWQQCINHLGMRTISWAWVLKASRQEPIS